MTQSRGETSENYEPLFLTIARVEGTNVVESTMREWFALSDSVTWQRRRLRISERKIVALPARNALPQG